MINCKHCTKEIKNAKGYSCNTCISKIRRYRTKLKAVEYKGGKCANCGYDKHIAALEFHHHEGGKDFNLGENMNKKWDTIVKELDKCKLLCSNCHRIEHSDYDNVKKLLDTSICLV